jgi:hypothetical protein
MMPGEAWVAPAQSFTQPNVPLPPVCPVSV